MASVAPARERGLKYRQKRTNRKALGRSREGAWIEICPTLYKVKEGQLSLPRGSVD